MGTAVLRSQDCLRTRFPPETLISTPSKPVRSPNSTRSGRRKRSPSGSQENRGNRCRSTVVKFPAQNLVMGQVTILKRGEELKKPTNELRSEDSEDEKKAKIEDEVTVLCSTGRLGQDPEMVPKQIRLTDLKSVNAVYAGSACATSPPPSSLPFPAFFTKKDGLSPIKKDAATKDLRRLLRLDMP